MLFRSLWYLNRSNGYVESSLGKPVDNYENPAMTSTFDKLYTTVGAHVMLDTQQIFSQFMDAFQTLIQMAQQRNQSQRQVLPPDAQVVKDTSMAETQRKAQADAQRAQEAQAKIAADNANKDKEIQARIAIENAKITGQAIQENVAQQNTMQMHGLEQANDMQKHAMDQETALQQSAMQQQANPPQPEGE